jgi:hypothetical protein
MKLAGWMGGWVDGWVAGKAGLRIAYSNQKSFQTTNFLEPNKIIQIFVKFQQYLF